MNSIIPHAPRAVHRAIDYIHANLAGNVRLSDIAGAARMSVFHFSRAFRGSRTAARCPVQAWFQAMQGNNPVQ